MLERGDVASVEETAALFKEARPLRGLINIAGLLDDGLLSTLTQLRYDTVFGSKVDGD
ncbi:hypothetical protein HDV62DRAFT_375164 [Trichoderma sp. SZMC 28011]